MSGTKERKTTQKGVLVVLGIICIVLVACLAGVVAAYTLVINDKSNTISSLNLQISQLNSTVANLQSQVASENSTINSLTSQVTNLQEELNPNTTYTVARVLDGFQLTMALEKINYTLGEPVNITLTLTNVGNQNVSIWFGPDTNQELYSFQVYNITNSTVYSSSWWPLGPDGLRHIPATLPLEIGETINSGQSSSWNLSWSQEGYSLNVPRGIYYIVGQSSFQDLSDQQKSVTIETTPIQITIS